MQSCTYVHQDLSVDHDALDVDKRWKVALLGNAFLQRRRRHELRNRLIVNRRNLQTNVRAKAKAGTDPLQSANELPTSSRELAQLSARRLPSLLKLTSVLLKK